MSTESSLSEDNTPIRTEVELPADILSSSPEEPTSEPKAEPADETFVDTINYEYLRASSGKRLGNYLLDILSFYVVIFIASMVLGIIFPGFFNALDYEETPGNKLLDRLITLIIYGTYMGLVEGVFKGRTIGKMITGTKAVNLDGSEITFQTAMLRGFSRAVPFAAFSGFGSPCDPWHDRWNDTVVVDLKAEEAEKRRLNIA